ncbi:MAG: transposase [Candidatus Hydrogenedentes bacterium]|nr:transposase [Candidatus Hydrogenedentota bacterium]
MVDAQYELPLGSAVAKASANDSPYLLPLMAQLNIRHAQLVKGTEYLSADKGYDSETNYKELFEEYAIRPVADIRATWQEQPDHPRSLRPDRVDAIFYTEQGEVLCHCRDGASKERDNWESMAYEGFEQDRGTLKHRCPAKTWAIVCTRQDLCNEGRQPEHGRIIRVPIDTGRRIFTPQPVSQMPRFSRIHSVARTCPRTQLYLPHTARGPLVSNDAIDEYFRGQKRP